MWPHKSTVDFVNEHYTYKPKYKFGDINSTFEFMGKAFTISNIHYYMQGNKTCVEVEVVGQFNVHYNILNKGEKFQNALLEFRLDSVDQLKTLTARELIKRCIKIEKDYVARKGLENQIRQYLNRYTDGNTVNWTLQ